MDNAYPQIPERLNITALTVDRHVAEGRGERVALYFGDQVFRYRQLQKQVNACGNALSQLGIGRGNHFLIRSHNRPESAIAILAGMKIGAVPIPANSLFRVWELEHILRNSESKVVLSAGDLLEPILSVKERCPSLKHVVTFDTPHSPDPLFFEALIRAASTELEAADTAGDESTFMIYTSGTTGGPKGVEHAHRWIVATGDPISKVLMRLTPEDISYSPLEVSFIYALGCNLLYRSTAGPRW